MLQEKIKILKNILGSYHPTGNEFLFFCPACKHHKQKLSVNLVKNKYHCWVCEDRGSVFYLVKKYGTPEEAHKYAEYDNIYDFSLETTEERKEKLKLPKEFQTLTSKINNPFLNEPLQYLYDRGLTDYDIVKWKMGVCLDGEYKERIIVPSFDLDGELDYFVGRAYTGHPQTYKNPAYSKDIVFNELFIDWNKDIVLTEGIFDVIVAGNAIPLLGSSLQENSYLFQRLITKKEKIYIALDPDAKRKEEAIINMFLNYGVDVFKIKVKPFKDVGEMPKEKFLARKEKAKHLEKDNILLKKINKLME